MAHKIKDPSGESSLDDAIDLLEGLDLFSDTGYAGEDLTTELGQAIPQAVIEAATAKALIAIAVELRELNEHLLNKETK